MNNETYSTFNVTTDISTSVFIVRQFLIQHFLIFSLRKVATRARYNMKRVWLSLTRRPQCHVHEIYFDEKYSTITSDRSNYYQLQLIKDSLQIFLIHVSVQKCRSIGKYAGDKDSHAYSSYSSLAPSNISEMFLLETRDKNSNGYSCPSLPRVVSQFPH